MTDWNTYIACDQCPALQGEACYERSSGGPAALPEIRKDVPHAGRKPSARVTPPVTRPRPQPARKSTATPVRRRAARSASTADAWRALADKQRRRN